MLWALTIWAATALAYNTGKTGSSTTGCGSCHGSSADSTTTVAFAADDTTLVPGETVDVTLTVSTTSSTRVAGGLNVSATGGSLAAGSNTQLSSSEITHSARQSMSAGSVTFRFTWTAPATEGAYTLRGAGNAVNANSMNSGDGWNLASNLSFTVAADCVDDDGDGWEGCEGDCDDGDEDVSPDAVEVCDGTDNDCDGDVDVGAVDASTWYADADGDGWGDAGTATVACSAPAAGWVVTPGDCDDRDGTAYPGGTEVCGGGDEDCDGTVDEPDAVGAATWYEDHDGDGFGDADYAQVACAAPAGHAAVGTDCDDTNPDVNPDAEEVCDAAAVDEDCDGLADDADDDVGGTTAWYADVDGDGYGDAAVAVDACVAPDGYVAFPGDCDDGDAAYNPGAAEDCHDPVDYNCDGSVGLVDGDSDGWAACADCDDGNADVSPDGVEACNLVDDDCDGTVDEGDARDAATWYADADGDGHGDPAVSTTACAAPEGHVDVADDCDDGDPDAYPGARETWYDGVDQACDGGSDHDQDGDGVDAPSGGGADCDDEDPEAYPGATERWYDGVDQDCDGGSDYDQDGDGADAREHGGEDCDDLDPAIGPHATETWYDGTDQDCDGNDDDQDGDGAPAGEDCDDLDPAVQDGCDTGDTGVVVDTGDGADAPVAREDDEATGCGCATGPGAPAGLLPALAAAVFLRRRRGDAEGPRRYAH